MRICVLGNSASSGLGLEFREDAWPWLVATRLSQTLGEATDVQHLALMPVGPLAADYAMAKVNEYDPDIVIVLIGCYACAVRTVHERVRRLFGERIAHKYRQIEQRFDHGIGTSNDGGRRSRTNSIARSVTRRLVGTAVPATADEVVDAYSQVLRQLASKEGVAVVVCPEPNWTEMVEHANPGANRVFAEVRAGVKAVVDEHRLLWSDPEPTFSAASDREALYFADGVHKTAEAHRMQADILAPVIEHLAAAHALPESG